MIDPGTHALKSLPSAEARLWDTLEPPLIPAIMTDPLIKQVPVIFYNHNGASSIDTAAYVAGHGVADARFLRDGVDRWSVEVDSNVLRHELEPC